MRPIQAPVRIALVYAFAGAVWIGVSDWLIFRLDPDILRIGQTTKGVLFVLLSAALIYFLVSRDLDRRAEVEVEREHLRDRLHGSQRLEAIGRLTGGIAHDFNNLLTAISGNIESYLERMTGEGKTDDVVELAEAASAAARAEELTRQLLAFGRRQELRPQTLDLNEIIKEMSQLLHRLIGDRIDIHTDLHDELWTIDMDRGPLQQLVMNLALNARDAMPQGGRLVLLTRNLHIDEEAARRDFAFPVLTGPYVCFTVEDGGVGMDAETRSRIYEPFFTTKEKDVGTGLGMSTVYGVVKQSGGYIDVESSPGEGTRFHLYFPKGQASPPSRDPQATPDIDLAGTETILVVDDEPAVRSVIVRTLHRQGFTTIECASGADALEPLRTGSRPIDLLLTDAIMPGMTGLELITRARSLHPHLPVLLMSGYAADDLDADVPYISKPFSAEQLLTRIRQILGSGQHAA